MRDDAPRINTFPITAVADQPDVRDWVYQPALIQLKTSLRVPAKLTILNQGTEGACTGFGLAAVINLLNKKRKNPIIVSPRMLYEMAKKFDEWEGEEYSGSSCRGAIQGWANMGVCEEELWPYSPENPGHLSVNAAKNARSNTIGAYYRLTARISDYHAALNETGAIFCSANVHEGWSDPMAKTGEIPFRSKMIGGHAFALIGYNSRGFWVQNSWGEDWGKGGLALWLYEDWEQNLMDGWVLQLALKTPQIRGTAYKASRKADSNLTDLILGPKRDEIAGHFVHIDDGHFHNHGRYFSSIEDVQETANLLSKSQKYSDILFYAHGGLNSPKASANRIKDMAPVFKKNGIYSYHWMYDTGILEELKDVILRREKNISQRVGGMTDGWDKLLEKGARKAGRALWREMKRGAREMFNESRAGDSVLRIFSETLKSSPNRSIHLAGHSTGAILHAYLLRRLKNILPDLRVASVHLLAPAATVDLYKELYAPLLQPGSFGIDELYIYYLSDELERDDSVGPYRKSLLYFVSRSFEEKIPEQILGMEKSLEQEIQPHPKNLTLFRSDGKNDDAKTVSTTHGGFDNDSITMNTMLSIILGREADHPFQAGYMDPFK